MLPLYIWNHIGIGICLRDDDNTYVIA